MAVLPREVVLARILEDIAVTEPEVRFSSIRVKIVDTAEIRFEKFDTENYAEILVR
jgi:hypothetical protein